MESNDDLQAKFKEAKKLLRNSDQKGLALLRELAKKGNPEAKAMLDQAAAHKFEDDAKLMEWLKDIAWLEEKAGSDVPGKNQANLSVAFGIASLIMACTGVFFIALMLGICGIVIGIGASKEMKAAGYSDSTAQAGITLSIIGMVLSVILGIALIIACYSCITNIFDVLNGYK